MMMSSWVLVDLQNTTQHYFRLLHYGYINEPPLLKGKFIGDIDCEWGNTTQWTWVRLPTLLLYWAERDWRQTTQGNWWLTYMTGVVWTGAKTLSLAGWVVWCLLTQLTSRCILKCVALHLWVTVTCQRFLLFHPALASSIFLRTHGKRSQHGGKGRLILDSDW